MRVDRFLPQLLHAVLYLRYNSLRSLLSVLGVACGVISFLIMMSVGEGAKRETMAQIGSLGLRNVSIQVASLTENQLVDSRKAGSQGLSVSDLNRLKHLVNGIENAAALREIKTKVFSSRGEITPRVLAVSDQFIEVQGLGVGEGRALLASDVSEGRRVCVLGFELSGQLGDEGRLNSSIRIGQNIYRVVGVLDRVESKQGKIGVISSRDWNHSLLVPLQDSEVAEMVIQFESGGEVLASLPLIRRAMEVLHHGADDFRLVAPQELLKQAERSQTTFNRVLGSIAIVSLLAGGIGIMNVSLANMAERTHEIGIRRALGATKKDIFTQFWIESFCVTGVGTLLGLMGGGVGVALLSFFVEWKFYISPWVICLPLLISMGTGLLFGLYPARRASKMDPIHALQ